MAEEYSQQDLVPSQPLLPDDDDDDGGGGGQGLADLPHHHDPPEESYMSGSLELVPESGEFGAGPNDIPTSQLLMQRSSHARSVAYSYGLLPETEPENFSQGVTDCSASVQGAVVGRAAAAVSAAVAASTAAGSAADGRPPQRHHQPQQQQQPPPPQQQQQQQPQEAPGWEDEIDELVQEQQELQHYEQEQQQQQEQAARPQQQQQQQRGAAGRPWGYPLDDPWVDEDPDALLEDMQEAAAAAAEGQQQQQQQAPWRQAPPPDDDYLDLDAELDGVLGGGPAAAAAAAAAGGAGAAGGDLDFDDELDAMLGGADGADGAALQHAPSSQAVMPPPAPKPQAFASLGAGGAAAGRKAAALAALAALQAVAQAPRQLASEVRGRAITVTGTNGARVYCQLADNRSSSSSSSSAAAAGGSRSSSGVGVGGGLLQQPIGDLLDLLAERRRQVVIAEVEAAQAAADAAQATAAAAAADDGGDAEAAAAAAEAASPRSPAVAAPAAVQRQLWVDKYAPRSFLSLLSEPRVNREIAAWMSRWSNKQHRQLQQQQQQQQQQALAANGSVQQQHQQHQQPQQQHRQPYQRQPQQGAGRGRGGGRDAGGRGGGRGGGAAGGGGRERGGQQQTQQQGISRGFDAARYKALQEARAAARVLLVVGPPGTGKTTLAHVIARHCGFRVVEINASDARTAASLTRAVTDAAEMAPVLDGERRRPCIVLDELDGAAGGGGGGGGGGGENHSAVAALVKLITGDGRSKKRKRGTKAAAAAGNGSSGSSGSGGLSVPVICTANDAYAPCLRPLRDIAAVYHFKPPAPDKLGARLAAIAAAEGLSLDKQAVSTLVDHSGCDVRTAINTLQLLARQQRGTGTGSSSGSSQLHTSSSSISSSQRRPLRVRITAADIAGSGAIGVKDVAATPLGVVREVLAANSSRAMAARLQHLAAAMKAGQQQQPQQRGRQHSSRRSGGAAPLSAAAAARLALQEHYSMLLDLGEHEQVLCVLHESLPDLVGLDVDLATTTAAADALAAADLMLAAGRAGGGGGCSWQYVPAPLLSVVGLVRRDAAGVGVLGSAGINLAWPRAQAECSRSSTTVRALLRSWRASAPAHAARWLGSASDGLLDLAPALRDISRPAAVRAVSAQLVGRDEERVLATVVDALVGYGVTYTFPLDDDHDGHDAAAGAAAAAGVRPAPLAPAIDTLHAYGDLPQPVARFLSGSSRAPKPGWSRGSMPLMLRQGLAQRISTAVITRLEQARHASSRDGGPDAPTPAKAAAAGRTPLAPRAQQQQQRPALPLLPKAPKGCWLDTIKVQAAAKRKAAILAVGANKRAALGQGAKAAAAAEGGPGAGAGAAEGEGGEGCSSHNGYTVLYKFNEGYTNAVKRPVKMAELLGAKL